MKTKIAFGVILLLLISTATVFAQEAGEINPCFGEDIETGSCPLDTWVIALVIAASGFAFLKLYRSKKSVL